VKGTLYINNEAIGEANFMVTDESMGGIGGELMPFPAYEKHKSAIRLLCEEKGIANVEDFNFKIVMEGNITLEPIGGIGITDFKEVNEPYVESAGIDSGIIEKIKATDKSPNSPVSLRIRKFFSAFFGS